jgi:geranylgeranyl reductase family protein
MYDAIVVGAGPGGSTAATLMVRQGLRVLLLDKSTFPRDKICGDAIGGKSVDALKALGLVARVQQATDSLGSWGVTFSGPMGDQVEIPFTKVLTQPVAPGFIVPRLVYDDLLFNAAVEAGAEVRLQTTVEGLLWEGQQVVGVRARLFDPAAGSALPETELRAPLVVGADGAYSVVARALGMTQLEEDHYCAGLRAYYEGVTGFNRYHHIELHFVEESIPGYFWIFPMANGRANVGIGMLSSAVKKRDVKLKPLLDELVRHPRFRDRFAHAHRIGPVKGWGLPLGSRPRPLSGNGWMLVGDAGSLIDPFTGEGIGNAMVSGMKAADWAVRARAAGNHSAAFLHGYDAEVMALLRRELRLSHLMQRLGNWKWLLNTVIRKAARSSELADAISCMFDDLQERRKLLSPLFYLRVLMA